MIPAAAVGAIHRLAWVTDETEAMGLVALAVQRGASPEEADEAFELWRRVRREDVQTITTTGGEPMSTGADLIAAERQRQIDTEGWTPQHDAEHGDEQLAWAAVCYAAPSTVYHVEVSRDAVIWTEPWPREWVPNANRGEPGYVPWRRPNADRVRELVKAGALIAAEIDRLQARAGETR